MNKSNVAALVVSTVGALKLVLNAFGVDLFNNVDVNGVANAVATLVAVGGPIVMHLLHRKALKAAVKPAPVAPVVPQSKH